MLVWSRNLGLLLMVPLPLLSRLLELRLGLLVLSSGLPLLSVGLQVEWLGIRHGILPSVENMRAAPLVPTTY